MSERRRKVEKALESLPRQRNVRMPEQSKNFLLLLMWALKENCPNCKTWKIARKMAEEFLETQGGEIDVERGEEGEDTE